jgi:phosphoglycolate phosphatase-like HAD superfamily hydrolase
MKQLEKYKVVLWDFDGVIMDSMPIRSKGFEVVLQNYPKEQVEQLLKYHNENGGLSRYVKFRYFFEKIRGEAVTEEEVLSLAEKFSAIMLSLLIDEKLLIKDVIRFISDNWEDYEMHIASGSDEKELQLICESLGLTHFFKSINGSPTPKKSIVRSLIENNRYDKELIALVGDSNNDKEAAIENSISFFGYNNEKLRDSKYCYIDTFETTEF